VISTPNLKIYTIGGSKYCAKIECNSMIMAPRRHQHPLRGANRPFDIAVTVNINAEFNLMAVNPIIELFWRDLVPEYCPGLEFSAVYNAPPFIVESLLGCSIRSLPRLSLHMHAEEIIPTFLMSIIYIRLCLPKALTLRPLRSYKMFEVLPMVTFNRSVGHRGILNFCLLRGAFLYWLARGITLQKGVP